MVVSTWLRTLLSRKDKSSRRDRRSKKAAHPLRRWVPTFEKLEERWLPSLTVVLTDNTNGSETSTYGQVIQFTAAIQDNGTPVSTGTVRLAVGGSPIGNLVNVDPGTGEAAINIDNLPAGTDAVTAAYTDPTHGAGQS